METAGGTPQFNQNSCSWDHPHPPPPPPSNFRFAGDGCHHLQKHNNSRIFHHNGDFPVGPDNKFNQFNDPLSGVHSHSKPHFARKRKLDHDDGATYPKLFVGAITRTVTQEEIHHLFEEHGNVVEVILFKDERTGQQKEYCFVKYASVEEAERAIAASHNQFALPGATGPLRVKYADGEKERLGLVQYDSNFSGPGMAYKVYVNGLNKEASQEEILDIFSSYGVVVDVYLMRDQLRQSRGCGFVGFSQRYMAVAAINGLDRKYVMRGCDRPLAVRFADPKRPKNGELSATSNSAVVRGSNWPNASHQVKQLQTLQVSLRSSCQGDSQQHTSSLFNRTSNANVEGRHDSQPARHFGDFAEASSALLSSDPAVWALCGSDFPEAYVDCDWSEHICPDGCKYYFNCVTCESRWEKPEEFSLYEQQWKNQRVHNLSYQEHHPFSTSEAPSCEEGCQVQAAENQKQLSDFEKFPLAISCGLEHCQEQMPTEASALDGSAPVQ